MKIMIPSLIALGLFGGALTQTNAAAPKATLPLVVYSEGSRSNVPFIPSGYMGNTGAIKMNPSCTTDPHSGKTCLKVEYAASHNWGGVDWQNPAHDWGDKPGGFNVTGAKTLSFWARGAQGGETVTFLYGGLGKDKPYHDTASGKLDKVALTKAWKHYTIDLKGQNLSQIKTGFSWVVGGSGKPITFYLDDIEYK